MRDGWPLRKGRAPGGLLVVCVLIGTAFFLAACSDDAGTGTGDRGEVEGTVRIDGAPAPGVELELSGLERHVAVTGPEGIFRFPEVPAGAYLVSISEAPGDAVFPQSAKGVVVAEGRTEVVTFDGSFIRSSSITGVVLARGSGLSGVEAVLSGVESDTTQTDGEGRFSFNGLRAGKYRVEIFNLPPRVRFSPVSAEVSVGAGDEQFVPFEGEWELTASVFIRAIRSVREDGSTVPADASDLQGTIEVTVGVDRGEDRLTGLELLLADEVVAVHGFGSEGTSEEAVGPMRASPMDLDFTVNTAAFDPGTGLPRFPNGEKVLAVRLASVEGGERASESTRSVVLRNPDTFHGTVTAERGPFTGEDGEDWIGGRITVDVVPVLYNQDRSTEEISVELRRIGSGAILERSAGASPPYRAVFPAEEDEEETLFEYRTPVGEVDQFRVRSAWYSDGSLVPDLPVVLADEVRIDNRSD